MDMLYFFEVLTSIFIGLVLGSFATALIYRVPLKKSWVIERSSCTSCKTNLNVFDLIPVFSWVMSGGACRHCKVKVSYQYPLIEVVCAAICFVVFFRLGFSIESLFIMAASPFLLALFVIDIKKMILPNILVFVVFALGFCRLFYLSTQNYFSSAQDMLIPYVLGALVYAGLVWGLSSFLTVILKKKSMGFGDVKFFLTAGLWLGLAYLPYFMILSGGLAIVYALLWRILYKSERFPFGPALITSFYSLLLYQGPLLL